MLWAWFPEHRPFSLLFGQLVSPFCWLQLYVDWLIALGALAGMARSMHAAAERKA